MQLQADMEICNYYDGTYQYLKSSRNVHERGREDSLHVRALREMCLN